ncbi:MAG: hypothetical protein ACPGQT_06360 [Rhodothermales bacterium]
MKRTLSVVSVFLLLMFAGMPTFAQQADPADVESIDAIMKAYYEVVSGPAGESGDYERDKTLHHPDAWIAIAGEDDDGNAFVNRMTLEGFYGDNAPRSEPFWEYEVEREVLRHGNMAHVWSRYASSREPNGEPYTTGINTITLWHDGSRWWVMGWMFDTSEE